MYVYAGVYVCVRINVTLYLCAGVECHTNALSMWILIDICYEHLLLASYVYMCACAQAGYLFGIIAFSPFACFCYCCTLLFPAWLVISVASEMAAN